MSPRTAFVYVKGFKIFDDRHGKPRCYHRMSGTPVDLKKYPLGSVEFYDECHRISRLGGNRMRMSSGGKTRNYPKLDDITPGTPLRLSAAAQLAFPDGSMTVSGLRRERDRGRLVVESIAGKEYTTLAAIEQMRKLCRAGKNLPVSGSVPNAAETENLMHGPLGSSSMTESKLPQNALRTKLQKLKRNSLNILQPNISPAAKHETSKT